MVFGPWAFFSKEYALPLCGDKTVTDVYCGNYFPLFSCLKEAAASGSTILPLPITVFFLSMMLGRYLLMVEAQAPGAYYVLAGSNHDCDGAAMLAGAETLEGEKALQAIQEGGNGGDLFRYRGSYCMPL